MSVGLGTGCGSREPSPGPATGVGALAPLPAPDLGTVVARVDGVPIYAAEVAAQMERGGESAPEAVEALVRFQLLAARAAEGGHLQLEPLPKALLVERLLERDFEPRANLADIPEAALREAYERNKKFFVHPRMVEVALLSVYTGPTMKPEPRKERTATAHALAEYLAKRPIRTLEAWQEIAKDPQWAARKVSFRRFWQGPTQAFGPFWEGVAGPIQKLSRPGQSSGLIVDDSGFHFALYLDEKPPSNRSFEEVRSEIAQRVHSDWQKQAFTELVANLAGRYQAKVFPDRRLIREP